MFFVFYVFFVFFSSSFQFFSTGLCFMSFCVFFSQIYQGCSLDSLSLMLKSTKHKNTLQYDVFLCFFSFFLWWENTKTHTICCVFVFFCLKSSWHFLPCVFCVFVFFFFKFLSWYFCTFLFCHVLVLPDQKFCRFFLAFFRFISCLLSANIFFLVNFNLFFF